MLESTSLIIVDVQYDFCPPSGALAVPNGLEVIPVINALVNRLQPKDAETTSSTQIIYSQDWHPPGHVSFYSAHECDSSAKMFQEYVLPGGQTQVLWPDHCVQESQGAKLHHDLNISHPHVAIRKGCDKGVDSYSAFLDVDGVTATGLEVEIRKHMPEKGDENRRILIAGLALDYCVGFTALDAKKLFPKAQVVVLNDACRGVAEASTQDMLQRFKEAGVVVASSDSA